MSNPNRYRVPVALASLILLGASACGKSASEESELESQASPILASGIIFDDANIRTFPRVTEDPETEETNICAESIKHAINISSDQPIKAFRFHDTSTPTSAANGPWLGIDVKTVPELLDTPCADDETGVVWISMNPEAAAAGIITTPRR